MVRPADIATLRWLGARAMHLDAPAVSRCDRVTIGCYGGATRAGADRNEDAALVWCAPDSAWEFAALVDAHFSAESAALLLEVLAAERDAVTEILEGPLTSFAPALQAHLVRIFSSLEFRARCHAVTGEASIVLCARRERYLWWLAVGDVMLYLFHPELARLGQFALTQRNFFEWIGEHNTFDLLVPCYTTGVRELLPGTDTMLLATDGLFEYENAPFTDPARLYRLFATGPASAMPDHAHEALGAVHRGGGRDSATVIAWRCDIA